MKTPLGLLASLLLSPSLCAQSTEPVLFGPIPYLSSSDAPVGFHVAGAMVSLEDFEDGTLDFGISASEGRIISPESSTIVDSVDGDDGAIDGLGLNGSSWFAGGGASGVIFTFSDELPTSAGIVWTDGAGTTSFEAFGPGMVSLGTIGPVAIADGSVFGTTGEDRFFGVQNAEGILALKLSNTSGGIEVDHVQFSNSSSTKCLLAVENPSRFEQLSAQALVPGNSNPFLAGQPDGVATKSDTAPEQSPVFASAITPGDILAFAVEGSVSHVGGNPILPPDGSNPFPSDSALGIAGYAGTTDGRSNALPINALVGVFLSEALPADPAPDVLSYPDELNFEILAPQVRQIFFVGDGLNDDGTRQQFVVPPGATRLFLGTTDGRGWFNNSGEFQVEICRLRNLNFTSDLGPTSIRFNEEAYTIDAGQELTGSILVDPIPPGGLYSHGMFITVKDREGQFVGMVQPAIQGALDFDGPLLDHVSNSSLSQGIGGTKGTAEFLTTRPNHFQKNLANFTLNDLPPGTYDLALSAWNELGPTEDIFVTGNCQTLDPFITFGTATLEVVGNLLPEITTEGELVLNRQTALIEQALTVTNNTGRTLQGFRLFITGLPDGVQLWNAHGKIDGVPYIDIFEALAPGQSMEILLEYYRPSRKTDFTPAFDLSEPVGTLPDAGTNPPLNLDLRIVRLDQDGLLVEFLSQAEKSYRFEYSDDMENWLVAQPDLEGTGERLQWIDAGPPKTQSFPQGNRFYRLIEK